MDVPRPGGNAVENAITAGVMILIVANVLFFLYYSGYPASDLAAKSSAPKKEVSRVEPPRPKIPEKEHVVNCESMPNARARIECLRKYGMEPVEDCENAPSRQERAICYNIYVKEFGDTSKCEILNVVDRDHCYHTAATDELEPEHCDKILRRFWKMFCYSAVAADSNDSKICDGLPDIDWIEPEYGYLPRTWIRDACYSGVAATDYYTRICDNVEDDEFRTYCKAISTNNASMCSTLSKEYRQTKCVRDCGQVDKLRHTPHVAVPGRAMIPYSPVFENVLAEKKDGKKTYRHW